VSTWCNRSMSSADMQPASWQHRQKRRCYAGKFNDTASLGLPFPVFARPYSKAYSTENPQECSTAPIELVCTAQETGVKIFKIFFDFQVLKKRPMQNRKVFLYRYLAPRNWQVSVQPCTHRRKPTDLQAIQQARSG
jgi:hypothetical protein